MIWGKVEPNYKWLGLLVRNSWLWESWEALALVFFDGSLAAAVLFLKIASLNFYFKCQCRIFFFL